METSKAFLYAAAAAAAAAVASASVRGVVGDGDGGGGGDGGSNNNNNHKGFGGSKFPSSQHLINNCHGDSYLQSIINRGEFHTIFIFDRILQGCAYRYLRNRSSKQTTLTFHKINEAK